MNTKQNKTRKKNKPGSECVKNPFTTRRPTKKIVSHPCQSDTRAALAAASWPARGATCCRLDPQSQSLTPDPENEAWKPGPAADVCQIIPAKKKMLVGGGMLVHPPPHL